MKSKKILASLLAVSMVSSFALAGCGKKADDKQSATGDSKIDAEQYLNYYLQSEPKSLDIGKSSDSSASYVLTNTQESLTRNIQKEDGNNDIVPGLAESWTKSEDGLTWTFKLRDAKWSDGQAITADQFVYSLKRTLDQNTAAPYAYLLYPIANAEAYNSGKAKSEDVGIKAIDEKTIEFKLGTPCPYFLDLTYFKIMEPLRQDIVEKAGDTFGTEANTMVSCGPFTMTEWVHNNKVELVKNPEYWDAENVKLEKVTMKIIKEKSAAMNELYNGSLDVAGVALPEWIEKLDATKNYEVKKGYDAGINYTYFNQNVKIFSNAKVRKAFAIAEDREGKILTVRKGFGEVAFGFVPPAVQIDGKEFRTTVSDLPTKKIIDENKDAKALLIEGMEELGLGSDPSTITVKMLEGGTDSQSKEIAEYAQQSYQKSLGIKVEVEYVEFPQFLERTDNLDYEFASAAWIGDYNDPNTFLEMWTSTANITPTGWSNPKYDELIAKAAKSSDQTERTEYFKQAENILLYEDCVISPVCYRIKNTYTRNYVKGYTDPLFGAPEFKFTYTSGRK